MQEGIVTADPQSVTSKLRTHAPVQTRHIDRKTNLGFPVVRLHDTCSHPSQRPFGHTFNKQANKQSTQMATGGDAGMTILR